MTKIGIKIKRVLKLSFIYLITCSFYYHPILYYDKYPYHPIFTYIINLFVLSNFNIKNLEFQKKKKV